MLSERAHLKDHFVCNRLNAKTIYALPMHTLRRSIVFLLFLVAVNYSSAVPINGTIGFGGLFFSNVSGYDWRQATQFSWLENQGHTVGDFQQASWAQYSVWYPGSLDKGETYYDHFVGGGIQDANGNIHAWSMSLISATFTITQNSFYVEGSAIGYLTGYDPTLFTYHIDGSPQVNLPNLYLATAYFTNTGVAVPVPDQGGTGVTVLLGLGVLTVFRRRLSK